MMFPMTDGQYQLVYNVLSFSLASMMATTLFLWMKVPAMQAKYQVPLIISGMVTFIAAYHYIRIFDSWTEAYTYGAAHVCGDATGCQTKDPALTGIPFNDATNAEPNDTVRALIFRSQWVTVISWLTYPVVYVFPMIGLSGANAVVAIQCGYCVSDIISKCGVGLIIYSITAAKSTPEEKA